MNSVIYLAMQTNVLVVLGARALLASRSWMAPVTFECFSKYTTIIWLWVFVFMFQICHTAPSQFKRTSYRSLWFGFPTSFHHSLFFLSSAGVCASFFSHRAILWNGCESQSHQIHSILNQVFQCISKSVCHSCCSTNCHSSFNASSMPISLSLSFGLTPSTFHLVSYQFSMTLKRVLHRLDGGMCY